MTNKTYVSILFLFFRRIMSECKFLLMNWKAGQRRLNWVGVSVSTWWITHYVLIPTVQISGQVQAIWVMKVLTKHSCLPLSVLLKLLRVHQPTLSSFTLCKPCHSHFCLQCTFQCWYSPNIEKMTVYNYIVPLYYIYYIVSSWSNNVK